MHTTPHIPDLPADPAPAVPADLPAHFDNAARLEFLRNYFNPDIDHFRLADLAGLRLSELDAYISSPEFQERLARQTSIAENRARNVAVMAQTAAIATLDHILASYNETERNELPARAPVTMRLRQRHRESARRAAWLILKVSGAITPALAARAKALKLAEPAEREHNDHTPRSPFPHTIAERAPSASSGTTPANPANSANHTAAACTHPPAAAPISTEPSHSVPPAPSSQEAAPTSHLAPRQTDRPDRRPRDVDQRPLDALERGPPTRAQPALRTSCAPEPPANPSSASSASPAATSSLHERAHERREELRFHEVPQ